MPLDPKTKKTMAPKVSESGLGPEEAVDRMSQDLRAKGIRAAQQLPGGNAPVFVGALCDLFSSLPNMTADELIFINKLKKSGELVKHMAAAEISSKSIRPVQIREAIADMDQYTDAAEKHLTSLQEHMARNLGASVPGTGWDDQRSASEKAKEVSLQEAKDRLEDLTKSAGTHLKDLTEQVVSFIESDRAKQASSMYDDADFIIAKAQFTQGVLPYDVLLGKLQTLGWEIKCSNAEATSTLKTARQYASEAVFCLVRGCRLSLDTAYQEAVKSWNVIAPRANPYPRAVEDEMMAIKDEIQSLWDEVVPVAHMAVEKQLIEPILQRINTAEKRRDVQNTVIAVYVGGCLHFLNERLSILAARLATAIYHHESLLVAVEYERMSRRPGASIEDMSKTQARKLEFHEHSNVLGLVKEHLKQHTLPFDLMDPLSPPYKKVTKLNEFVQQRAAQGDSTFQNVHKLFESAVKAGIDDDELGMRMVLNCVTADNQVNYSCGYDVLHDANTEESIALLRQENQEIDTLLAKLKLPGTSQIAHALRPGFKHALEFLDKEKGMHCYHPEQVGKLPQYPDGTVRCPRCQVTLRQIEIIRRWAELPEFKMEPWASSSS